MIIIFAILLAAAVIISEEKYIELLSNEEFQDKPARRAEGDSNEEKNSKQISSEESLIDFSNRDDKSYIPDVDLNLSSFDIDRRSNTAVRQDNSANSSDSNNGFKDEENQIKTTSVAEPTVLVPDSAHSGTENIVIDNTTIPSTALPESSALSLRETEINSNNKSTTDSALEHGSTATEPYKNDSSNITVTDESTTDSITEMTTNESTAVLPTMAVSTNITEGNIAATDHNTAIEDHNAATEEPNAVAEDSSINDELIYIINEHLALTQSYSEEIQNINESKDNAIVNKVEDITKVEHCSYCHRVYEIFWPTKHNNQRSQDPIKDRPYFVHEYKYLPNFGYYNLENHFKPNDLKDNSFELNYRQLQNNDAHDKTKISEIFVEFNNKLRKFGVVKKNFGTDKRFKKKERKRKHKIKGKKGVRIFDDTNNDISPEVMQNLLGAHSMDFPTADTYKSMVHAQTEKIIDNGNSRGDVSVFQDLTARKRSNAESKIKIHVNVLNDMIFEDSNALKQYDWLATTVEIQSALSKILELINRVRQLEPVHPTDLQILKNIVFLHNFSLGIKSDKKLENKLRKSMKLLSRKKRKRKNTLLKEKGLSPRVRLYLRTLLPDLVEEDEFTVLYQHLNHVLDGLVDLHKAIRHIADVTKFNHQNWYDNLKQLYLSADEKDLRELLLHISMSRLIDLIVDSCKHGLDNDVIHFLQTHEKDGKRIVEEMLFIENILDDIKIN